MLPLTSTPTTRPPPAAAAASASSAVDVPVWQPTSSTCQPGFSSSSAAARYAATPTAVTTSGVLWRCVGSPLREPIGRHQALLQQR